MACHTVRHHGQASVESKQWGSTTKNLLKISDAASKSCAFYSLCLPPFNQFFHMFSDSAHVSTGDSDLHDVISLCLFLQLFLSVCVCVRLHVAVYSWGCLQVLMRREQLPESACCRGKSKKQMQRGKYAQISSIQGASLRMQIEFGLRFGCCNVAKLRWGVCWN